MTVTGTLMSGEDIVVGKFAQLFAGRDDCYGSWDGGCVKERLTIEHFRQHLNDGPYIGIYPSAVRDGETWTKWGCIDIDFDDFVLACNLEKVLSVRDMDGWTEKTRKGYHVWLFASQPVPARDMRRCLQATCAVIGYDPKEVNPKQEELKGGIVGNYVRLPYPRGLIPGMTATERAMVDRNGDRIPFKHFLGPALDGRATPEAIASMARLYLPPTEHVVPLDINAGLESDLEPILHRLNGRGFVIWRDGPLPEADRSTTLTKLAGDCLRSGLSATEAFAVVRSADQRWGKFHQRADGDLRLQQLIERVF